MDTELIVADSPEPRAFAIPGPPGRILVTVGMLSALEPAERRVLLAHERAHLAYKHAQLEIAATLAAATDPLLRPVRSTVVFLVELWADERAADAVGDRATTARALARAALSAERTHPACALSFTDRAVTRHPSRRGATDAPAPLAPRGGRPHTGRAARTPRGRRDGRSVPDAGGRARLGTAPSTSAAKSA